jgi:hypothetical protein
VRGRLAWQAAWQRLEGRATRIRRAAGRSASGWAPVSAAQDDQLLFEQEILRDYRSHAFGTTQLRAHDDQFQQGENFPCARQRRSDVWRRATLRNPGFSARIGTSRPTGTSDIRSNQEISRTSFETPSAGCAAEGSSLACRAPGQS